MTKSSKAHSYLLSSYAVSGAVLPVCVVWWVLSPLRGKKTRLSRAYGPLVLKEGM